MVLVFSSFYARFKVKSQEENDFLAITKLPRSGMSVADVREAYKSDPSTFYAGFLVITDNPEETKKNFSGFVGKIIFDSLKLSDFIGKKIEVGFTLGVYELVTSNGTRALEKTAQPFLGSIMFPFLGFLRSEYVVDAFKRHVVSRIPPALVTNLLNSSPYYMYDVIIRRPVIFLTMTSFPFIFHFLKTVAEVFDRFLIAHHSELFPKGITLDSLERYSSLNLSKFMEEFAILDPDQHSEILLVKVLVDKVFPGLLVGFPDLSPEDYKALAEFVLKKRVEK